MTPNTFRHHACSAIVIALTVAGPVTSLRAQQGTTGTTGTNTRTTQPPTSNVRLEKDLLGEKEVPAKAYYGVQTTRALENFQLSGLPINHYPGFVEAWAIVKIAAARANADVGAMKKDRLDAIEKAGQALLA